MIQYKKENIISHLIIDEGKNITKHEDIEDELVTFYKDLLIDDPTHNKKLQTKARRTSPPW